MNKLVPLMVLAALAGCAKKPPEFDPVTGGNPRAGRQLVARYGCGGCHEIAGVAHADSKVGPALTGIRERSYVGGVLPNSASNLMKWIQHPRAVRPDTTMPELGVSQAEARDMAAYLYSQ